MKLSSLPAYVFAASLLAGQTVAGDEKPAADYDYGKTCAAFGPGFTNLAGTDICIKIGGYVKFGTSFGHSSYAK